MAAAGALSGKQAISAKALAATDQAVQNIKAKWQQGLDEAAKVIKIQQQCQYQCCNLYSADDQSANAML